MNLLLSYSLILFFFYSLTLLLSNSLTAEVMNLSARECLMGLFDVLTENVAREIAAKCLGFADTLLQQVCNILCVCM